MTKIIRRLSVMLLVLLTFFPAIANQTLTLYGETHLSNTAPINNVYLDEEDTRTQVIFPASDLAVMTGEVINSMKFYTDSPITVDGGSLQISLGETEKTNYTDIKYVEGMTPVATISMVEGATEVLIVFDMPYYYKGGNLVFETIVKEVASDYCYVTYLGERPSNYNTITRREIGKFLPKTTFDYGNNDDYSAKVLPFEVNFKTIRAEREDIKSITVTNTGLSGFAPTFRTEAPFKVATPNAIVTAGSSLEVPVTFAPTAPGNYTGTLTVDCGEAGIHHVTLYGTAIEAANDLIVGDSTDYASFVPIYGPDIDIVGTQGQVIYPQSMLGEMVGSQIVGLLFHIKDSVEMDGGVIQLSLKEVNSFAFSNSQVISDLTTVATLSPVLNNDEFVFYFDEPYKYQGGHLLVDCQVTEAGVTNYHPTYFYGTPMNYNCGLYRTSWYDNFYNDLVPFLPAATFAYQKIEALRGDVDGNGEVTIADVTDLIDILLNGTEPTTASDCNLDGSTSIADVTALIDYLLSGAWE